MDTIEMTDADGDALSVISRDHLSWISCTSEDAEVTVGPFPTRFLCEALSPDETGTEEMSRATAPAPDDISTPAPTAREVAWAAFQEVARTESLRAAFDAAMDAVERSTAGSPRTDGLRRADSAWRLRRA